ncbi:MAG TPA: PspC domain-containing protein [Arachnia sp.]|nr:PspC domain-containing protein [Arachnia sp.]HMT85594.1 PspC domain-containing protein [Arachnia sp.]
MTQLRPPPPAAPGPPSAAPRASLPAPAPRPALTRDPARRMIAGVAGGLAEHLGVSVLLVRALFVVLTLVWGLGLGLYAAMWVFVPVRNEIEAPGLESASRRGMRPPKDGAGAAPLDPAMLLAGAVLLVGVLWLFVIGNDFPARVFWPMVIGAVGVAVLWVRVDDASSVAVAPGTPWWRRLTTGAGLIGLLRLVGGMLLVALGISWLVATQVGLTELPMILASSSVLVTGLAVVLAPWLHRQRTRMRAATDEKLRAEARADMAAHLHDSVLQTLALIQRRAEDPVAVATLARRQERELRTWLYGEPPKPASFKGALQVICDEVEMKFSVDVELVCVGDLPVDPRIEAMVQAAGEAVTNAAKHSGAPRIDVFAEVDEGLVEVFVRDRGTGFDESAVPEDRMGVRESIKARMQRHGGSATIRSAPGEGTEVKVEMRL